MTRQILLSTSASLIMIIGGSSAAQAASLTILPRATYPGMQTITYRYGPININPGQNIIRFNPSQLHPKADGYITRFVPNMTWTNGKIPPVDRLHLHHAVWLINSSPTFAAGEEKTAIQFPQGFGFRTRAGDQWLLNDMLHNLWPTQEKVYLTWTIDWVPMNQAQNIKEAGVRWMDVAGIKAYPIFDVIKGSGTNGKYSFPDQATGIEAKKVGSAANWTVPQDTTLVGGAGHLHPGGLWLDLRVQRGTEERLLFRSEAKYFEPAGAVSWDVAMTATKPSWRIRLRAGDRLKINAVYDSKRASWYESMGILPLAFSTDPEAGGVDPFQTGVDTKGWVTHGHLPENDNHGGGPSGLADPRKLPNGKRVGRCQKGSPVFCVNIKDYVYAQGDLSMSGPAGRPPLVAPGNSFRFINWDATSWMTPSQSGYHTITACKAPCNRTTGIAYPLADADIPFDSGELGYGPGYATPTINRNTWSTPKTLPRGTYSYFCRVHPFMRGAFRVG